MDMLLEINGRFMPRKERNTLRPRSNAFQQKALRQRIMFVSPIFALAVVVGLTCSWFDPGHAGMPPVAPVMLANPLQGTDSSGGFSHGNEYPAIAVPFPMNTWAPYTQPVRDSFYYQYRQNRLRGIRQTHQPSPWIADY